MKKFTILIALLIGLAVFLIRFFSNLSPVEYTEVQLMPLLGIYLGLRVNFKEIHHAKPEYKITYLRSLWVGFQMSLLISVFYGLLSFIFVDLPSGFKDLMPKIFFISGPAASIAMYGGMLTIICSAVFVYFKPIKINHDNFKLHTGHHSLY